MAATALAALAGNPSGAAEELSAGEKALAEQVLAVFKSSCAKCHAPGAEKIGGDLDFILDLKRLAAIEDFIVPGNPQASLVYQVVADNDMPPRKSGLPPLADADKDVIHRWIEGGAGSLGAAAPDPQAGEGGGETGGTRASSPGWRSRAIAWLGNLHMPAVHFPIALLLCALLAEILGGITGRDSFKTVVRFCLWVGFLSAVPAAALGWARAEHAVLSGDLKQWTLAWHRWLGVATASWALVAAGLSEIRFRKDSRGARAGARLAIALAALLAGVTGAFGGALVYGWHHYAW
jgi:uncharacterized membrane protein/mono/diheme cytochrome c family protein